MRRSTQVFLVLMGGGLVAGAAVPLLRQPECDPAQQVNGACPTSTTSNRSTSSGWVSSGGSTSAGRAAAAGAAAGAVAGTVSRGGFGSTGAAYSGGGG